MDISILSLWSTQLKLHKPRDISRRNRKIICLNAHTNNYCPIWLKFDYRERNPVVRSSYFNTRDMNWSLEVSSIRMLTMLEAGVVFTSSHSVTRSTEFKTLLLTNKWNRSIWANGAHEKSRKKATTPTGAGRMGEELLLGVIGSRTDDSAKDTRERNVDGWNVEYLCASFLQEKLRNS